MTNRRGFLGLLAHLPVVGVLFKEEHPPLKYSDITEFFFQVDRLPVGKPFTAEECREAARFMWTPLSERLPGSDRLVLVCDCADGVIWVSPIIPSHPEFEEWVDEHHVTHWMDLPPRPLSATDNATGIVEFTNPVVTIREERDTLVLDGRHRVEAARAIGWPMEMDF